MIRIVPITKKEAEFLRKMKSRGHKDIYLTKPTVNKKVYATETREAMRLLSAYRNKNMDVLEEYY